MSSRALNVAAEYVDGAASAGHGERPAYLYEGTTTTFDELRRRVNQTGNALAALGVEMGERVAILLPNQPEFVASFFGAIKIGAVPVAVSFAVTPNEHALLLADSGARAIVATPQLWLPLHERRQEFPDLRHVLLAGGGQSGPGEHDLAALTGAPTICSA